MRPETLAEIQNADHQRIEAEIASDASPVGIDAKKTHVMILAKLESIERRLDRLERGGAAAEFAQNGRSALAAATDTFDDTVARLAERGVDVDARARAAIKLLERATDERSLEALEGALRLVESLPGAFATIVDVLDDEAAQLRERGVDVDAALRNGITALLYLGQRVSQDELEALGTLLRSDVLDPRALDIVGRLGRAMAQASERPRGVVGPIGAIGRLRDADAKRSTAFLIEFAREFGAALEHFNGEPMGGESR